ncbi:MAG: hypothetical protein JWQ49_3518 [Edaphobacter sp.]|nr:hypothetical protein [Edaphobacter sp.]
MEYGAAFAEALGGDAGVAQAMAEDLTKRFSEDFSKVLLRPYAPRACGAESSQPFEGR